MWSSWRFTASGLDLRYNWPTQLARTGGGHEADAHLRDVRRTAALRARPDLDTSPGLGIPPLALSADLRPRVIRAPEAPALTPRRLTGHHVGTRERRPLRSRPGFRCADARAIAYP